MAYKFYGGVHPRTFKTLTYDKPIKRPFMPKKVVIPLSQHVGSPAEPVVSVGDNVTVGQEIAKASGYISSPIHATITGEVTRIAYSVTPTQARSMAITIESKDNEENQDFRLNAPRDVSALSKEELLKIIKESGIVGLGGAAFPTHVKLSPPKTKPIDTVILNGAECEPYITCDHRLMLEKSNEILKGLEIILKILGAEKAFIAIEDNKLAAIYAMERALEKSGIRNPKPEIVVLKTKYPQGAEKQVIKSVLNRVVPAGGLPLDVGCVVQNVGTAVAIYEAAHLGKPLIERVVTITGTCVREPVNLWVRIGTLLSDLTNIFGGFEKEPKKIIFGGPVMGINQYTMDVPIIKGSSGVVFLSDEDVHQEKESICIRCGRCVEVCPMGLAPTTLMYRVKFEKFQEAKDLGIVHCYECGSCAYTCPAKIPLLDWMKFGKSKLSTM